jgi:DNA-binding CsgD family transcriptional regulator
MGDLVRGLPFDAGSIGGMPRITWDDYCTLVERIEAACGGPEAMDALIERSFHRSLPREIKVVMRGLVSPKNLFRFIFRVVDPSVFGSVDFDLVELSERMVRVSVVLRPELRPCFTYFRASVAGTRNMPRHLGLPLADVEVEELTARSAVLLVRLPASRTLAARTRTTLGPALGLIETLTAEVRALSDAVDHVQSGDRARRPELDERLAEERRALGLTDRQAEVLARVVRGLSNKEIAQALDCAENTVEHHVTQLLRKADTDTRMRLIARFWAPPDPPSRR